MDWFLALILATGGAVVGFYLWRFYKDVRLIKTVTSLTRGEWSEKMTILVLLKMGISPQAIFHDCYIRKASGQYTQVDLIVATKAGLLTFEIKDYSGWIFGHFRQQYWTQVLAYGREKHRFYNPIMQNNGHIKAIRENLPLNQGIPIYSIIVFFGNCEFKKVIIEEGNDYIIYSRDIEHTVNDILSRSEANYGDKQEIISILRAAVNNGRNPEKVSPQIRTAQRAGRNRPRSYFSFYFNPLSLLKRPPFSRHFIP